MIVGILAFTLLLTIINFMFFLATALEVDRLGKELNNKCKCSNDEHKASLSNMTWAEGHFIEED